MTTISRSLLILAICTLFLSGFAGTCPGPPEQPQMAVQMNMNFTIPGQAIGFLTVMAAATEWIIASAGMQSNSVYAMRDRVKIPNHYAEPEVIALLKCPLATG